MGGVKHRIFVTDHVVPKDVGASGSRYYFVAHYHNYGEKPPLLEEEGHPGEAPPVPWGISEFGATPEAALERLYARLHTLGIEAPEVKDAPRE